MSEVDEVESSNDDAAEEAAEGSIGQEEAEGSTGQEEAQNDDAESSSSEEIPPAAALPSWLTRIYSFDNVEDDESADQAESE